MKHLVKKSSLLANNIMLAYEVHGDDSNPVLLLVQGLGMTMTVWPEALIEMLVEENYCVVIFDNRDAGFSQKFDDLGAPNLVKEMLKNMVGFKVNAPYQLSDMMEDTACLMDELGIKQAHVIGVSMGGMIAQLLAIHYPEKVKSLTSIMSTTGDPKLPGPAKPVKKHLFSKPASDTLEARLSHHSKTYQLIGSPAYPPSEEELQWVFQRLLEGGVYPLGTLRQMVAIMAAKNRSPQLQRLTMPCQVIHGEDDALVPVAAGIDTAKAIPGSKLTVIKGMGHDLPAALLPELKRLIVSHASAVS